MKDNEEILDSGEIFKELEPLGFSIEKDEPLDWSKVNTSVKQGGSRLKTHYLIGLNKNVLLFVPSFFHYLQGIFWLLWGSVLSIPGFIGLNLLLKEQETAAIFFILVFFSLGLVTFLYGLLCIYEHPIAVFHKRIGLYWKGKEKDVNFDSLGPIQFLRLLKKGRFSIQVKDIIAIQLLKETVKQSKHSFVSYEINLVLKDGKRINVVDHGNKKAALTQAKRVSKFLGVPLYAARGNKVFVITDN